MDVQRGDVYTRLMRKFLFLFFVCVSFSVQALTPPLEEDRAVLATHIVKGKITSVQCTGEFKQTRCVTEEGYRAKLEVAEARKGQVPNSLNLHFFRSRYQSGCTGPADLLHYPGDSGIYYLRCEGKECGLVNWDGVEFETRSQDRLPRCR